MSEVINFSRRNFIKTSLVVSSGLLLGCTGSPKSIRYQSQVTAGKGKSQAAWLNVDSSGMVTMFVPSSEMGQGVATSLPMIIAEEMDADWEKIKIEFVPVKAEYNHPEYSMQVTGGSTSVKVWWDPLRRAGASAKEMLVKAASQRFKVPTELCQTDQGFVILPDGKKVGYGELAEEAALLDPPSDPTLKSPSQFKLIGKSVKRLDTPSKINGTCTFGIDVDVPGMVYATVAQSPVFGGSVKSFNKSAAMASKGVEAVVEVPNGIAVVADTYWHAKKGLAALAIEFDEGPHAKLNDEQIREKFREILDDAGKESFSNVSQTIDVEYEAPYLAHATMEPMNFTAHVTQNHCEVWGPTQAPSIVELTVEKVTGLDADQITVHTTFLGGGFGRRVEQDFVEQAVTISKAIQKPVKLVWSREEDMQHDFYRQAAMIRFQLGLDKKGTIRNWAHQLVSPSLFNHYFPIVAPGAVSWVPVTSMVGDPLVTEGATEESLPYTVADIDLTFELAELPVPVGFWRSVAHSHNGFFIESAIDEAAHAAKEDPYLYRRRMLGNDPRYMGVLDAVAKKANWNKAAYGRYQGIALHKSFDTYVAEVAEISVNSKGEVTIHRIVCAVDCGIVVNPDTVKAQIESGVIYGLVAAMEGEISIENGRVKQSNFHDYKILRMADIPQIDVYIVPSAEAPTGVGEPGTPPIAPAVTNAIYAATGVRIRSLPVRNHLDEIASVS